jgi:hypothetical protein
MHALGEVICNFIPKTCRVHRSKPLLPVFRIQIRIHRIHMFLGLPDPDPLDRGMDPDPAPDPEPDPDPSIILLSSSENSKKSLDSDCYVTIFSLYIFEK